MRGKQGAIILALSTSVLSACIPAGANPDRAKPASQPAPAQPPSQTSPTPQLRPDLMGLIEPQPVWLAQQVVANAQTVTASTYTVKPGDTLRGIGNRTGAGSEILAKANALAAPYLIQPGQKLKVPAGRYHMVSEGETGIAIAQAYGVSWSEMVDLNGLTEPYVLRKGQRLLLPGDAPARPPATLAERAAAFQIDIDDVLTGGQPAAATNAPPKTANSAPRPLPTNQPIASPASFAGSFAWPISGKILARFGPGAAGVRNSGIDIAASRGTPIHASADGVVAYAGDKVAFFGGLVLIRHGSGWVTAYGHAGRVDVVRGQKVRKGQIIGLSGDTGYADQPKLHFEIRRDRTPIDPLSKLPAGG